MIWIKGKNTKNRTSWQKNQYPEKKGERDGCLLFWLKIYSIIGNFNWKLGWRQVPKLEVCWFFFSVFLLYSRAILSFSLSPSLLLCPFFIVFLLYFGVILGFYLSPSLHFLHFNFLLTFLAYILYSPLSNRLGSVSLLIVCLFVSSLVISHIGNWIGGLMSYLEEFESRSKGSTTLRAIGLRSTPNWVKHQR